MSQSMVHRSEGPRSFGGVTVHAAPGIHERALELLRGAVSPGERVADLGAGSGAFSVRLRESGYVPVAVDMSVDHRPDGIEFIQADVTDLAGVFEENSLPAAAAVEAMEHLRDPIGFLDSVHRVLRPGGVFLATTPNVTHPYSRLKFTARGTFWLFGPDEYATTGHTTPLPEWLLRAHLQHAGFKDVRHGYLGDFDFRGPKAAAIRVLRASLRRSGAPLGVHGDGSTLVMLARKSTAAPAA